MRKNNQILAIVKKEILLGMRFKASFFIQTIITPFLGLITFFILYGAVFSSANISFGHLNKSTYVSFIILGSLMSRLFSVATTALGAALMRDKFWKVLESQLIMPIAYWKIFIGLFLGQYLMRAGLITLFTVCILCVIGKLSFLNILLIALGVLVIIILGSAIGIFCAAIDVTRERYSRVTSYIVKAVTFTACFFYPPEIFQKGLTKIIYIIFQFNPIYHCVKFVRDVYYGSPPNFIIFSLITLFSIFILLISLIFFNRMWKKYSIEGY